MPDDLTTWLAAELDADPAACAAAIEAKQLQAENAGRPWRSPATMVKKTIPLDEWRVLVTAKAPRPRRPTLMQCADLEPHERHQWDDGPNLCHCQGVEAEPFAFAGA